MVHRVQVFTAIGNSRDTVGKKDMNEYLWGSEGQLPKTNPDSTYKVMNFLENRLRNSKSYIHPSLCENDAI